MTEENLVHFYVHVADDGTWAQCRELPNCMTESVDSSLDSLWTNIQEVFELYLRDLKVVTQLMGMKVSQMNGF